MRWFQTAAPIALAAGALLSWASADDRIIAEQVAGALHDSGRLKDYNVGVKYHDGTVWLSGRVSSQQQMKTAVDVAGGALGVEEVVNNLSVSKAQAAPTGRKTSATMRRGGPVRAKAPRGVTKASGIEQFPGQFEMSEEQVPPQYLTAMNANNYGGPVPAMQGVPGGPLPAYAPGTGTAVAPARYDQPCMPGYAWPSYAAYPNYAGLTYPKQYSPTAWPYIGPFYPYPQVPLGWRKVTLEWDDGWWFLDFRDAHHGW